MSIHKKSIIFLVGICILSFLTSLWLDYVENKYWTNIFIGMFSSGLLALFLSIISYNTERKKALEEFYIQANKILDIFNSFENDGNLEKSMDIVIEISKYDCTGLINAYGNIDFMFGNKTLRSYIYRDIYNPIMDLDTLIKDKAYHFKEYKKAKCGNLLVMKMLLDEIDKKIMFCKNKTFQSPDGSTCKTIYRYNKFVKSIREELNSRYYEIMYGHKNCQLKNV